MTDYARLWETMHHRARAALWVTFLCLVFMPLAACGGDADDNLDKDRNARRGGSAATGERARYGNLSRDGFTVEPIDLNQDETPDQWTVKNSNTTQRIERDLNFDGQVDLWQYPDKSGNVTEEEMDLDMDGNVDVVLYYEDGVVTRKEMSVDFEGTFSIVKFYDKNGDLLRVERDEDGDGDIDVWEYYENKKRVRIGWDETDDGQPDRFDNLE